MTTDAHGVHAPLPLGLAIPAIAALGLCAATWVALHAYEFATRRAERVTAPGTPAGA